MTKYLMMFLALALSACGAAQEQNNLCKFLHTCEKSSTEDSE